MEANNELQKLKTTTINCCKGGIMRSFGKNILPLLSLFFLLFILNNNKTFADTLLDGVELEGGYRNYYIHDESSGYMGASGVYTYCDDNTYILVTLEEGNIVRDVYDNWTFNQQGLYSRCWRWAESYNGTLYYARGDNSCSSCTKV